MKKTIGLMTLMAVLTVLMAMMVHASASDTFVNPSASDTLRGVENLNISGITLANCTVTGTSALTGDTLATVQLTNVSCGGLIGDCVNGSLNTVAEIDASDWILTATCHNTSAANYAIASRIGITIDNTKPGCVHSQSSKATYNPEQTWTVTGTNSISAEIQFGSNSPYTMTETSDVFTYTTKEGQLPEGTYTITGTTNDGLNSTICLLDYVRIDSEAKVVQMAALASQGQKGAETTTVKNSNNSLAILLIIGAAVYYFISRKK